MRSCLNFQMKTVAEWRKSKDIYHLSFIFIELEWGWWKDIYNCSLIFHRMRIKEGHLQLSFEESRKKQDGYLLQIYSDSKLLIQPLTSHVNRQQTSSTPSKTTNSIYLTNIMKWPIYQLIICGHFLCGGPQSSFEEKQTKFLF